jgi:uncharacterized protein YbaR (Trm112 family)
MRVDILEIVRCPVCKGLLRASARRRRGREIWSGKLRCGSGQTYDVTEGLPDLTYPPSLADSDRRAKEGYESGAGQYERGLE